MIAKGSLRFRIIFNNLYQATAANSQDTCRVLITDDYYVYTEREGSFIMKENLYSIENIQLVTSHACLIVETAPW